MERDATKQALLRVSEVCQVLALGRSTVYELLGSGELPTVRIGRAVRVRRRDVDALVERGVRAA